MEHKRAVVFPLRLLSDYALFGSTCEALKNKIPTLQELRRNVLSHHESALFVFCFFRQMMRTEFFLFFKEKQLHYFVTHENALHCTIYLSLHFPLDGGGGGVEPIPSLLGYK